MTRHMFPAGATRPRLGARIRAAILALAAAVWVDSAPTVSPYLSVTVPAAGGLVDLFTFPMPPDCPSLPCTDQRAMLAKLVVDETAGDLYFEMRTTTSPLAKYPVVACSTFNSVTPGTGSNVTLDDLELGKPAATVRARFTNEPVKAGFKMLTILVRFDNEYNDFPAGETWKISARPFAPGDDHYSGFRVDDVTEAAADPLVTRSKLALTPASLNFGSVQTNLPTDQSPVLAYAIKNIGTGPLTLSGTLNPPAGSAFSIFGSLIVGTMNPMENVDVNIQFRPTVVGEAGPANLVNMSIASNDPASPAAFTLQGRGITLDGILLLDISGSMKSFPNSDAIAPELESRLWRAKLGARQLFQAYNDLTGGKARFGLHVFPNPEDPYGASAFARVPIQQASTVAATVESALDRIPPGGAGLMANGTTPMAEGIKSAQGALNTASSDYRPAILLLSDGAHNEDSRDPPRTPDEWIPGLTGKGIKVFPVAYGENAPGVTDLDVPQLQRLADGTGGQLLATNPSDPTTLPKAFRGALRTWLGLNIAADPKGTIHASENKTHEVCIDASAYTITFVLDWTQNLNNAIGFTLTSPQGQSISSGSPGVSFYAGMTYGMYVVKGNLVRGGKGAGRWKLNLKGGSGLGGALDYSYNVLTQSAVNLKSTLGGLKFHTGLKDVFTMQLARPPGPAPEDPKVTVAFDIPQKSFGTYLSTAKVDPKVILATQYGQGRGDGAPAAGADRQALAAAAPGGPGERLSLAQRKALALARDLKQPFSDSRRTGTVQLVDDGTHGDKLAGDGIFSTDQLAFPHDGVYNYHLVFSAATAGLSCWNLEDYVSSYASVFLTGELLKAQLKWEDFQITPFYDSALVLRLKEAAPEGFVRKGVVVTPKDEQGNYFGPGRASEIKFALTGAEALGTPVDNLDGSYTQVVEYKQGANPGAAVSVGEAKSEPVSLQPAGNEPTGKFPVWLLILLAILVLIVALFIIIRRRKF